MHNFKYGRFSFEWMFQEADIKEYTLTVEKGKPVLLRGKQTPYETQERLIRKRARWIREQIQEMDLIKEGDIVSGSRIKYLGRHYMAVVMCSEKQRGATVAFDGRKFYITVNASAENRQTLIERALDRFFKKKAVEKLFPRVQYWEKQTGLSAQKVKLFRFPSRWASCNLDGVLEFHPKCMELASKVLDYVIVHELVHTVELNHTKQFWKLVEEKFPDWKECHRRLNREV